MTQEKKELLLKDLCARLPYNVIVKISHRIVDGKTGKVIKEECHDKTLSLWNEDLLHEAMSNIKPYLRPMSSITEEEKEELKDICTMYDCDMGSDYECFGIKIFNISRYGTEFESNYVAIDWLNKKMFDYRGLISMGLALEAPEGMYNTKTE